MAVPYTFGSATAAIPLSQLDSNFATTITLGNTAIQLGNTVTTLNNMTLANVTISSGSVTITDVTASGNVTISGGTANGVAYLNGSKVLTTGSALVFDGANLGVGTSSPASLLTLYGATSQIHFTNSATGTTTADGMRIGMGGGSSTDAFINLLENTNLIFNTNATERMRLDSSGNLGLGVTPSAWAGGTENALQVKNASIYGYSTYETGYSVNAYYNSGWKYISTNPASQYKQSSGVHSWFNAPSGTAGNAISFTQAMTLDASGNLGVGTTSPAYPLDVVGASSGGWTLNMRGRSADNIGYMRFSSNNGATTYAAIGTPSANTLAIEVNGAERARIDSSGNLLVGTTSAASARIYAEGGASYHSVRGLANTAGNVAIYGTSSNNSSTGYCAYFNNTGSGTGLFISNTAAWQSTSDQRLKTDVKDLDSTSKLLQLRAVDYLWKSQETSEEPNKRNFGFIAQEVKEIFPDLVGVSPDGMFSVEYTGLIAPLVKAIQEQQAMIASQSELITQLTTRITALEGN